MSEIVVAIDGPAGAGKSTVAKAVAKEFGLRYLDTGAMYRALALKAMRNGLGPSDGERAGALGDEIEISFGQGDPQPVYLDGEDVTNEIRTLEVGELASALSAHPQVRRALARRQRDLVARGGVTLEGRDVTTVIAPNAEVKIYMTASLGERTRRRCAELQEKGLQAEYNDVYRQIEERDMRDSTREDSPLTIAPDAQVIDTDSMSIEEAIARVRELILAALDSGGGNSQ